MILKEQEAVLKSALEELLVNAPIDKVVGCAVPIHTGSSVQHPRTSLLHVRFNEDQPQIEAMARFLWKQCFNYALTRRRRIALQAAIQQADISDVSAIPDIYAAVRDVFIEFNARYPSRASEVGEVLAYCIAIHYLKAAQMAAKVALKTSPNMPVHGLDGIHAIVENGALTIYFLESKLAKTANDGASDYAESVAGFLKNEKQYLREYELVGDLGNLDTLEGEARELILQHFDVVGNPELPRRERSVGVICYSETKHYSDKIPVSEDDIAANEKHFCENYSGELEHHRKAVLKHLKDNGADPAKSIVFFVAVPDVNALRERFYAAMGVLIKKEAAESEAVSKLSGRKIKKGK